MWVSVERYEVVFRYIVMNQMRSGHEYRYGI